MTSNIPFTDKWHQSKHDQFGPPARFLNFDLAPKHTWSAWCTCKVRLLWPRDHRFGSWN